MDVLFIHQAFPAQFGRLALELTRRFGWRCRFLIETFSACPTPSRDMLDALEIVQVPPSSSRPAGGVPWPQVFGGWLDQCRGYRAVYDRLGGGRPDLVVAHGGQGAPIVFLREVIDSPIINYCEYFFPTRFADLTYRVDLPPAEVGPFYPRCINATTLLAMQHSDAGYSPTHFQRNSFPARYRPKIEVHFDGVDTEFYRPRRIDTLEIGGQRRIGPELKVVTYVARGLESMRGFDLFAEIAGRIARERSDVVFLVAGADQAYYGWDNHHTGGRNFKDWALERLGDAASRITFLGHVTPEILSEVLARSDLHLFPSVPFVPSWSFFNAMASGAVVIGADIDPVREVIEPGRSGLVAPLFDTERWAELALEVLDQAGEFEAIGRVAVDRIQEHYSLDVCVPALRDYFERIAGGSSRNR